MKCLTLLANVLIARAASYAVNAAPASSRQATAATINRVSDIRRLTKDQANEGRPVLLHGVFTYIEPARYQAFFQDESGGIYVDRVPQDSHGFHEGQRVEIKGVTGTGMFAPVVAQTRITILGSQALPLPERVGFDRLISGLEDSQRVEIQGVIRAAREDSGHLALTIAVGQGGRIGAMVRDFPKRDYASLVDATVHVRGIASSRFNQLRQLTGVSLNVIGLDEVVIEKAAQESPFDLPVTPIGRLMNFTQDPMQWHHRVRVQGVVTHYRPGYGLYLKNEEERLYVEASVTGNLVPGDRVDVAGFPAMGEYTPSLQDAVFRKRGAEAPPAPVRVTATEVLSGSFDKALIQIEGVLITRTPDRDRQVMALTAQNVTFNAFQQNLKSEAVTSDWNQLIPGSRLRLTGICIMLTDQARGRSAGFEILLRSPRDIATMSSPSWWSFARLISVLGAMAAAILAGMSWIFILRRRVKKQTEVIRQTLVSEASLEKRYRDLFGSATDMIYAHDLSGRLTSFNGGAEKITGYKRKEAMVMNIADLAKPEQRDAVVNWLDGLKADNPALKFELEIVTRGGRPVTIEVNASILYRDGDAEAVECIARDVSERNRIAAIERDRNEVLEALGKNEPLALVLSRLTRLVERQRPNSICAVMLVRGDRLEVGAAPQLPERLRGMLTGLRIGTDALTCGAAAHENQAVVSSNISTDPRWTERRDEALSCGVWACWSNPILSGTGSVLGTVALYQLVPSNPDNQDTELLDAACRLAGLAIEHSELYNQLSYQSQHDGLTGLPNRSLFEDRLRQALASARRSLLPITLMYLDLDRFKQVNDTLGHKSGDALLQEVVVRLKACLRETDTLARIGGDEFTLILPDIEVRDQAAQVAGKLISALSENFVIDGNLVSISASIGISMYPDDGEDTDSLQQKADLAMYHAKRHGKGQFQWYSPAIAEASEMTEELTLQLR